MFIRAPVIVHELSIKEQLKRKRDEKKKKKAEISETGAAAARKSQVTVLK
jgi:hypothetical protein